MNELLRRLHIYSGLFSFTALMVFGAAGLIGAFHADPRGATRAPPEVSVVDFEIPPGASDREVADLAYQKLASKDAAPVPTWALGRNPDNVLVLHFYGPNGIRHATVLEQEKKLRIEHDRSTLGEYVNWMHALVLPHVAPKWRVLLWSIYLEISIFTLLFMVASGVYLWLASRPRLGWAQASFAVGTAGVVVLYLFGS
jgi:hypothetical protein